ncbi:MAG: nucleotidyltransferase family protein [Chloroflexota bacterium]
MISAVISRRDEIAQLCRNFHVRRLDLFGSAARGDDFEPEHSDLDLLVSYLPDRAPDFAAYLALSDALTDLLGWPVDLVIAEAMENPFVRAGIERTRQPLYAA